MSLFSKKNQTDSGADKTVLAEMALMTIHDGVIITNKNGAVQFINPAAVAMTECATAENATGLDYGLLIKLETKEGRELPENENKLIIAMKTGPATKSPMAKLLSFPKDEARRRRLTQVTAARAMPKTSASSPPRIPNRRPLPRASCTAATRPAQTQKYLSAQARWNRVYSL